MIVAIAAVTFIFLRPDPSPLAIAPIESIKDGAPELFVLDPPIEVYLLTLAGEVQAFSARSPTSGCRLVWVGINNRFEDPCSGAKWCIDGSVADRRFRNATALNRFKTELAPNGQILIYPLASIEGEPLSPEQWVSDSMDLEEAIVECPLP